MAQGKISAKQKEILEYIKDEILVKCSIQLSYGAKTVCFSEALQKAIRLR